MQRTDPAKQHSGDAIARGMGWFSLALGAAEVAMPRAFSRMIGAPEAASIARLLGLRELASGVGILASNRPGGWMWSRVAGDMIDLAVLGTALRSPRANARRLAYAAMAVAGATALDTIGSVRTSRRATNGAPPDRARTTQVITLQKKPEEVYRFWRELRNLAGFMEHLETVEPRDEKRSHWVACGPMGARFEWDAEITEDVPNRRIAWRSVEGSEIETEGAVTFEPGPAGRGTRVRVELEYRPPAGVAGAAAAKIASLFGEAPEQMIREDLRRLRQILEAGEIPTTEGQPHGRSAARISAWRGEGR